MTCTIALSMLAAAAAAAQPSPIAAPKPQVTPAALSLFERDWVLMNWALKYYDSNGDILIQPQEAETAAAAFRKIADSNGDGRVTPDEYRTARAYILTHD